MLYCLIYFTGFIISTSYYKTNHGLPLINSILISGFWPLVSLFWFIEKIRTICKMRRACRIEFKKGDEK